MPAQTYVSTLAKRLGQKVVAAHNENKDKPLEIGGFRDLPPDVKNGIAQLSSCAIQVHGNDVKSEHLRGQEFFQAFGIAKFPEKTALGPVLGLRTRFNVELCDIPGKNGKEGKSFAQNWAEFQGFFQRFGIDPPTGDAASTAEKIMAYYNAAMKSLVARKPHFGFTTREWTPPRVPGMPEPKPMTFETWYEECQWNGTADPGAGVTVDSTAMQPTEPFTEPPQPSTQTQRGAAPPSNNGPPPQHQPDEGGDPSDAIIALVEAIMSDPNRLQESVSEETKAAIEQLAEAARQAAAAAGISPEVAEEMIGAAPDYDVVGQMALGVFDQAPEETAAPPSEPTVGMKAKFCKRNSKGEKLADGKTKQPFPAQEIEVVTVDSANKTVTAKTKDGKPVTDLKKNVINIKWEWLE